MASTAKDKKSTNTEYSNILKARELKDQANTLFNEGDVLASIEIYSEAIELSGLPNEDLGILYSNRSAAYMKADNEKIPTLKSDWRTLALADAEKTLNLRSSWFKSHFRVATALKSLGRYKEAIPHFEKAVGIEPANSDLKAARDDCRRLLGEQTRNEPGFKIKESLEKLSDKIGVPVTPDILNKTEKMLKKSKDPHGYLLEGHRYEHGMGCQQNYEKAAECFAKAASLGNADAKYNLGRLTKDGKGVKQDFNMAIKILKEAADCPPNLPGGGRNTGVAEAEHALGLMYEEGIGVPENPSFAAHWYQRGSDHGCGNSSNNLGLLYMNGRGVERNADKAVHYFKLAASRQNPQAMASLADHYLFTERDSVKAMEWHIRAVKNGDSHSIMSTANFEKLVSEIERDDKQKRHVEEFEADHGLSRKNLTFQERISRMMRTLVPGSEKLTETLERVSKTDYNTPYSIQQHRFDFKILEKHALAGSTTAQTLVEAMVHFAKGIHMLQRYPTCDRDLGENVIREFANCQRTEHLVATWTNDSIEKTKSILQEILNRTPDDLSQELEIDARICYAALYMSNLKEMENFLQESIRRFPNEVYFYRNYCSVLAFAKKFSNSVMEANKALKMFSGDLELLYYRAASMKLVKDGNPSQVLQAYNEFLDVAPKDNRKIPECYYVIALLYFQMNQTNPVKSKKNIKGSRRKLNPDIIKYYKMGLEAEKIQLPCFMPYDSNSKLILQGMIDMVEAIHIPSTESTLPPTDKEMSTNDINFVKLTNPLRVDVIISFRSMTADIRNMFNKKGQSHVKNTTSGKYTQSAPPSTAGLKPITFQDIDPSTDKVYKGRVIKLTSIEDASFGINSFKMLGEDKNGDVQRIFIYNIDHNKNIQEKFGYGCRISIMNPYLRIAMDNKIAIRVDDPKSIFYHVSERLLKRCRFCGKDDADKNCGRCKRVSYCSKECQVNDWKIMKHKLICEN